MEFPREGGTGGGREGWTDKPTDGLCEHDFMLIRFLMTLVTPVLPILSFWWSKITDGWRDWTT